MNMGMSVAKKNKTIRQRKTTLLNLNFISECGLEEMLQFKLIISQVKFGSKLGKSQICHPESRNSKGIFKQIPPLEMVCSR